MPRTAESTDRITVGLTRRSSEELDQLQNDIGLSKTDLVNRSIGLYKFVMDQINSGSSIVIRDAEGTDSLVHMQ